MSDNIKFELEGADELLAALSALPRELGDEIIGKANRDILNRLVKPQLIGSIPYSPKSKAGVKLQQEREDKTAFLVGITSKAYWLRFIERGTVQRQTKSGANRGMVTPKPFIERTLDESVPKIIEEVAKEYYNIIKKIIEKRIKRLSKKLNNS